MIEPHISVIIPIYNLESYIEQTLKSVLNNGFDDFEIVCVDDGSTDSTAKICERFVGKCSKIKLLSTENNGVSSARNIGLKNASGKYVVFMDGDDTLAYGALTTIYKHTLEGYDILVFGAEIIGESSDYPDDFIKGTDPGSGEYEYSPNVLFGLNGVFPFVWNKAYRRDFLLENNLEFDSDLRLGEDQVFSLTVFPAAKKILFISDKLYIYRFQRPDSVSTSMGKDDYIRCACHLDDLEKISELWLKKGYYNGAERQFSDWCADFAVNNVLMVKLHKKSAELASRLSRIIDKNEIPYREASFQKRLKYEIIKSGFLLRLFWVYRIFRWHI